MSIKGVYLVTNYPHIMNRLMHNIFKRLLLLAIIGFFINTTTIAQQYNVAGDAFANGGPGCYTLTNATGQSGAVWNVNTIDLTQSIDITLILNFGCNDADNYPDPNCGADGMTFVLQPNGTGSFGSGGGVGFNGLTPSFGVVMDTYENGPDDNITFDNAVDHMSININGDVNHGGGSELVAPSVARLNGFPNNIEDCNNHAFRFVWTPGAGGGTAKTYFDGTLMMTYTGDIVNNVFGGNPVVYWGISGSTGGCWNTQTVCMSVVASFITVGSYCANTNIQFQDQSISGTTINSWHWDFGDGSSSSLQNPQHSYTNAGTYQVELTITNIAGFSSTITQEVSILAPIVQVDNLTPFCAGDQVTLNGHLTANPATVSQPLPFSNTTDVTIPDGGISSGWNGSGGSAASSVINVTGLLPGWGIESVCLNINHTYDGDLVIYLKDPCGNLLLLSNEQGGGGDNYTNTCFSPVATGSVTGGWAPFTGTWVPEGGAAGWTNMLNCATANGNWTLLVGDVYSSDAGSILDWSITFTNQIPVTLDYLWTPLNNSTTLTPSFTAASSGWYVLTATDDFGCTDNDSVYLTVNPVPVLTITNDTICPSEQASISASGATTYQWTGGSTDNPYLVSPSTTTTYTVTGTSSGCSATATATVVVNPGLNVSVNSAVICDGQSATLDPEGGDTYIWNTTSTDDPYIVSPIATTTYTVTGSNMAGCSGTATATVTVNPLPVLNINAPAICEGEQGILTASGANTYLWSNGSTDNPLLINPNVTSTYSVTGTSLGCTSETEATIVVNPLPVAAFSMSGNEGCAPYTVNFADLSQGTLANWNWNFSTAPGSVEQNPVKIFTNPGQYDIVLTVTTDQGCVDISDPQTINVRSVTSGIAIGGKVFTSGETVNIFDASQGASQWFWDLGNGTTQNVQNVSTMYNTPGEYIIQHIVSNDLGCKDTSSITIVVNPLFTLYIPNAFTPNNDGINDNWVFSGESWQFDEFEVYVFDRWGKTVFHTTDVNVNWDGCVNGNIPEFQAIYQYRLRVRDKEGIFHEIWGSVSMIQ